jgi:D-psicose/D-tagatose/L-ribulose 3-epimerase
MNFGINTFLFTSPFTNHSVHLFKQFKEWGFDSVEIAIENPDDIDPEFVKAELDRHELKCHVVCAALSPVIDLRGTLEHQLNALAYLKGLMDKMVTLGATILAGPLYSSVGRADMVPADEYLEQWKTVTKHLKTLSKYAEERNIRLAIEPLNRFETDFINTVDQGLKMIKDVDSPALCLHMDTFHMNIEEKDQSQAILKAGSYLGHFHACGCDRGTPGNDHINWLGIVHALKSINYKGSIVIESFTPDVKVIARAAAIWRQTELSQESIAKNGVEFLKKIFAVS